MTFKSFFHILRLFKGLVQRSMVYNRLFIHGLESSSQGNKARYFRERYPEMIIRDFQGSLGDRMKVLNRVIAERKDLILVGSSFGGLMASIFTCNHPKRVNKLILLAPALNMDDFKPYLGFKLNVPATIFHGESDEIVPMATVRAISEKIFLNLKFNVLDDDHPLSRRFESLDWDNLLLPA